MRWVALLLGLGMLSCTGTETGNPSFDGSLGYDAYTSQPKLIALRSADADAQTVVDSAWIVLGDVHFSAGTDCNAASRRGGPIVPGLGAGDHAATQAPASEFELTAGSYCGVRVPLKPAAGALAAEGAPPELGDHSFLIEGSAPDATPFRIASALERELFLRADAAGFELDAEHAGVLIGFDVASWLDGLDWSAAQVTEGVVSIDSAHNLPLLEAFEQHVARGIALFRDEDRDGLLDPNSTPIAHAE